MKRIFNLKFKIFNLSGGFTILESIVAISILSISIAGIFTAVQTSLSAGITAKDEVRAFYLAQEAVEIIRNRRDNNQLDIIKNASTVNWLNGIAYDPADPCFPGKTCKVDATGPGGIFISACSGGWGSCPVLKQDSQGGSPDYLYGYDVSWTDTNFRREVQMEMLNDHEVAVIVRISWKKGLMNHEFRAKTLLLNWI